MFTWVCPSCGAEWDLATKQCPNCAGKTAPAGPSGPPQSNLRFWASVVLGTLAVLALLYGWSRFRAHQPPPRPAGPRVELERPAFTEPARAVEIAGLRMSYDARDRPQVRAVIINHSEDQIAPGTSYRVALRPVHAPPGSPPLGSFTMKLDKTLQPGESRDVRAPLDALATLAAMPPWHQIRLDIE